MIDMNKVVLLNSGGLDSALLGKMLYEEGKEVHSLWVNTKAIYEEQARIAAEETARRYCASHKELVIDFGQHSNFYENMRDVIMYDEADEDTKAANKLWLCPLSPLVICTMGSAYAKTIGAAGVYAGLKNRADEFKVDTFNQALVITNMNFYTVPLVTPLYPYKNYEELLAAMSMKQEDLKDFLYTQSCSYPEPCGVCYKCVQRKALGELL